MRGQLIDKKTGEPLEGDEYTAEIEFTPEKESGIVELIFDIDVKGGVNLKRIFGEKALSILIKAPSMEVLRQRLEGRGTDSREAIERRLAKAESEMEFADGKFDYVLVNDSLDAAFAEAEKIVGDFLSR